MPVFSPIFDPLTTLSKPSISRIGVFTSGGDAPGMNAAIRAVVRASNYYLKESFGISRGYEGMIDGDINKMGTRSVGNIIQRGGTILKTARSKEFKTKEGRAKAIAHLKRLGIDALVAIGGDGTFRGLHELYLESGIPSICIPGTIDNDIAGTDYTIGYDTATNTAVEAIDRIRDTALSHNRLFFIEVMGRKSGYIAINSAIAGGAVAVIIPEVKTTFEELFTLLEQTGKANKKSSLVVVAEGSPIGGANELARMVAERSTYFDTKVTILGHLQRGGSPTYFDRVLASRLGLGAVEGLIRGEKDCLVGIQNNKVVYNPFDKIMTGQTHEIDEESLRLAKILST
ncbi:MAG: 6-phosphofructokinase [Cytophagales bacterium]|nr:6-phosphofructokinase [Cytophagales bacterium]